MVSTSAPIDPPIEPLLSDALGTIEHGSAPVKDLDRENEKPNAPTSRISVTPASTAARHRGAPDWRA
jgi:hypothetical protein